MNSESTTYIFNLYGLQIDSSKFKTRFLIIGGDQYGVGVYCRATAGMDLEVQVGWTAYRVAGVTDRPDDRSGWNVAGGGKAP